MKSNLNIFSSVAISLLWLASPSALANACEEGAEGYYYENQDGTKGGFVASTAFVDKSNPGIVIGPDASICDFAVINGGKILTKGGIFGSSEVNAGAFYGVSSTYGGVNNGAVFYGKAIQKSGIANQGQVFNGMFVFEGQTKESGYHFAPQFNAEQLIRLYQKPNVIRQDTIKALEAKLATLTTSQDDRKSDLQSDLLALQARQSELDNNVQLIAEEIGTLYLAIKQDQRRREEALRQAAIAEERKRDRERRSLLRELDLIDAKARELKETFVSNFEQQPDFSLVVRQNGKPKPHQSKNQFKVDSKQCLFTSYYSQGASDSDQANTYEIDIALNDQVTIANYAGGFYFEMKGTSPNGVNRSFRMINSNRDWIKKAGTDLYYLAQACKEKENLQSKIAKI